MKIAIPAVDGKLCMHFGHCREFALVEVEGDSVVKTEMLTPPPHEPGVLPKWLNELGADLIIAGGMGQGALNYFQQFGIRVIVGAPPLEPAEVVKQHLAGNLQAGENVCGHDSCGGHH